MKIRGENKWCRNITSSRLAVPVFCSHITELAMRVAPKGEQSATPEHSQRVAVPAGDGGHVHGRQRRSLRAQIRTAELPELVAAEEE